MGFLNSKSFIDVPLTVFSSVISTFNAEKNRLRKNTSLYNRAVASADRFKEVSKELKRQKFEGELNERSLKRVEKRLAALSITSAALAEKVLTVSELIQITPFYPESILQQLVDKEEVHPVENIGKLKDTRLGDEGDNKDCQAIVIQTKDGLKVLAQIFRYHVAVERGSDGKFHPKSYPGNVEKVRGLPVEPLTEQETHSCYYTISSKWFKSGPALIAGLQWVDKPQLNEITISPATNFYDAVNIGELLKTATDTQIRQKFFDYLYSEEGKSTDPVANFHLGNGASIGWIHINRDAKEHVIVVNYVYDREMLDRNKVFYKSRKIPVSEDLGEELGDECRPCIRDLGVKHVFSELQSLAVS